MSEEPKPKKKARGRDQTAAAHPSDYLILSETNAADRPYKAAKPSPPKKEIAAERIAIAPNPQQEEATANVKDASTGTVLTPVPQPDFVIKTQSWMQHFGNHAIHILIGAVLTTALAFSFAKLFPSTARYMFCDTVDCSKMNAPPPTGAPASPQSRIVVFDTAYPGEAYSKDLRDNGETNAHFVAAQLRLRKLIAIPAIIGRDQAARDSFLDPAPDLAIVHRSSFDPQNVQRGDDQIAVLIGAAPKTTRFLIYSRKSGTDSAYARRLATRSHAQGRVTAVELEKGDPWAKAGQIQLLLNTAEDILARPASPSPQPAR